MSEQPPESQVPLSPWRSLVGSVIASSIAFACYKMMAAIALSFATKPIQSDNFTVQRISAAVRTLVVGLTAMGTGIFAVAALGLLGLTFQLLLQKTKPAEPPTDS